MSEELQGVDSLGVWVTISDLAKRKGVSRQSARERIDRLERAGLISTRQEGRSRLVELVSYDRAVGDTGDAGRETGAETKRELAASTEPKAPPANAKLRDAQTERAQYETRLKALDYAERIGQLVPIKGQHGIETGLVKATERILRELNAPLNRVTDIMVAAREGEPALRRLIRDMIRAQRLSIATRLTELAGEAADDQAIGVSVDIWDEE